MRLQYSALALFAVTATSALAQSFNIAIGPLVNQPSSSYGAAGLPGYWNATPAYHNTNTYNLVKLDGTVTGVHLWQYGGTELRNTDDPATTGDDQQLMDHCQVTYTPGLETCVFFYDLQNGDYEVLIYAMMPAQPAVKSNTSSDEESGNPHIVVGGAWPGQHIQGVTFARHLAHVGGANPGLLRTHSGIVPGQDPAQGSAYNGVQIRLLPARSPGDMNCDGVVNASDIAPFVNALVNSPVYYSAQPTCRIDNADINGDSQLTSADVPGFIAMLGL
jgi:hypothetical protein